MLSYIKAKMKCTFNVDVALLLHSSWFKSDPGCRCREMPRRKGAALAVGMRKGKGAEFAS